MYFMARHTIGDKRGSVRGAPPDVYLPFMSDDGGDAAEAWEPSIKLAKHIIGILALWFVLYLIGSLAITAGWLPDELRD
jgi:hypothetical protein